MITGRLVQPKNGECVSPFSSIHVTLEGMAMEVRLVQFKNVPISMLDTLSGIVMEIRLEQPENA